MSVICVNSIPSKHIVLRYLELMAVKFDILSMFYNYVESWRNIARKDLPAMLDVNEDSQN